MKSIRQTLCVSLLTLAIASTAMAGNIGGMKAGNIGGMKSGNIGGLKTASGNIGGLRTEAAGNIGGLRTQVSDLSREGIVPENSFRIRLVGNIGGLLSVFFSIF